MKLYFISLLVLLAPQLVCSQKLSVQSPNQKIKIDLLNHQNADAGEWYLKITHSDKGKLSEVIPQINLGLARSDQDFLKNLKFLKAGKVQLIREQYHAVHGKRSQCSNLGNEVVASFENPSKAKLNVIIRAYDDGITFRYEFPEKQGTFVMKDEFTSYSVPPPSKRWLEKWNPANERFYTVAKGNNAEQQEWGYPALFQVPDSTCWFLLHEADVNRTYCGSKLSNVSDPSNYKITFPDQKDGRGKGESTPTITLPWKSPWRVIILGTLADIVESTLVDDVSPPSVMKDTEWIKPGLVSWNYWSNNHGTKDYQVVCSFADLAARMGWPYTLLDWEWDTMGNGGQLQDAVNYILSKGVKPLLWYNSGGAHTWVLATPKDRMLTHENRMVEFDKLQKMGFAGVKIDFFESEKQNMIAYYLDILEDAAKFKLLVYFHGCLVPRGWARTYPHLMTYEGVMGAEWYNNVPFFTMGAPSHNTILPFTRNVIGAMDYTPVTFTNSQHPHVTSFAHELALSVLFESGLQHMADRPEGYDELPDAPKTFLKNVPNAWDDIKLVEGYPGQDIIIARSKGDMWYVGGANGEIKEKQKSLRFDFLSEGTKYQLTLISDGIHDRDFVTQYLVVDNTTKVDVKILRLGGFAASLTPIR
ncbi:MAG TPA: glycoside hydrolase family 97 catalytic domain-containing protein [Ohtaekwangia sp.]